MDSLVIQDVRLSANQRYENGSSVEYGYVAGVSGFAEWCPMRAGVDGYEVFVSGEWVRAVIDC